ncbi:MAG: uroporphyrinogen-III C-methyltransferase [Elusimicrobia bacterium RIFCSPLOWO2_01_FULL_54_10]|nr:MAG: uroporphyrinogen-III C-methyltransferase [Elusimicrobia bacterium RIFCSPLOWO2_01_FULL_54_10]
MKSNGKVYLVGGGPGDPGLLTLKGKRCLEQCDVVVYDALVNPELLRHCPPHTEKIFAGKRRRRHALEQSQINALIVKLGREGKTVCRFKGGDPFMFGRGGEEAEALSRAKIPYEVVPGVSSVTGAPATAGIPLTHRKYASHVTVVTGQNSELGAERGWEAYRFMPKKTLVILMGYTNAEKIAKKLMALGWPASTPAALICSGTLPAQTVITGRLRAFTDKVRKNRKRLSAPGMIIVGDVVGLRRNEFV